MPAVRSSLRAIHSRGTPTQSFTHPNFRLLRTRFLQRTHLPLGCNRALVMSLSVAERQAILLRSCPNNIGYFRQLTCYSRQVSPRLGFSGSQYYYILCFDRLTTLSGGTVILCSHFSCSSAVSMAPQLLPCRCE